MSREMDKIIDGYAGFIRHEDDDYGDLKDCTKDVKKAILARLMERMPKQLSEKPISEITTINMANPNNVGFNMCLRKIVQVLSEEFGEK